MMKDYCPLVTCPTPKLIDGLHELPILEKHLDDLFTLDVAAHFILQAGDDPLGLRVDDIPTGGVDPLAVGAPRQPERLIAYLDALDRLT